METAHLRRLVVVVVLLALVGGCAPSATTSPLASSTAASPAASASAAPSASEDLVVVGRIVTMAEPAIAEALLIEDGLVAAVGTRDDIEALAGEQVPIIDIGENVAYPGFIDAHAHWIGDRDYYEVETPADAMAEALSRGWTSISEQWVNDERIAELEALAADDALPLRVDAYLALNEPNDGAHFGDWYTDRTPGPVTDRLRVRGLKITLDNGWGTIFNWEPDDLLDTIGRANEAGWQVSVHTVSTEAHDMVLDAFEAAISPTGPNPLHHRIDHAIQVTDDQLARMVAMNLATVIHLDAGPADWTVEDGYLENLGEDTAWLSRYRDFVDAGLHVAGASDAPWVFPEFALTDDIGRPVDQIAGGMDARGRIHPEPPEWMASQLLTAEQGLRAVTLDAAYALGDEMQRGHLAPGTLGDVTILSGDVTGGATPDEIRAMAVIASIVGGGVVFCGDAAVCADGLGMP